MKQRTEKDMSADIAAIEEAGVAFDPTSQHMDLSKEEKRRTTALLLAIQAYDHLIIKDAEMYRKMKAEERRGDRPITIHPATIDGILEAAIKFDLMIAGGLVAKISKKKEKDRDEETK